MAYDTPSVQHPPLFPENFICYAYQANHKMNGTGPDPTQILPAYIVRGGS
ncbi:MAG: hypothetical protein ACLTLQ_05585 [[Clostridium] scindens]